MSFSPVQPTPSVAPAPPGHALHHASSTGSRPRPGDSFVYPETRSPTHGSPRTSLHEDPSSDHHRHRKKKSMTFDLKPLPSRGLISSVAGGVHGLPVIEDHELTDKDREHLARFHRFPLPADDESHAGLKVSDLPEEQRRLVRDVVELMCARPTKEILERTFARDAVYEDPNLKCVGWQEIAAQWFLLAKLFPHTRTLSFILLKPTPTFLRWEMVQEYTWVIGTKRLIHSLVELTLDGEGKVTHMVDRWDGRELEHRMTAMKRLHAKVTKALVPIS